MATRDDASATSVWEEITAMANEEGVVDLGQGWPDFGASRTAREVAARAMLGDDVRANQYAPVRGDARLIEALIRYYESTGYDLERCDRGRTAREESVVVTASATEAIYGAFQAALRDAETSRREIVFVEPFFPWYKAIADDVGAVCVVVRARAEDEFRVDVDAVRAACSRDKTALLVMCSPHNPTGHVMTPHELQGIAALAEDLDLTVLSDEVYERSVFDDHPFTRLATVGAMCERTITIGSASKLLNLTGWRVGWAVGPKALIDPIKSAHSLMSYAAPNPLQMGVAEALNEISLRADGVSVSSDENAVVMYEHAKALTSALSDLGLSCFSPSGGYFLVCDVSPTGLSDMEFCRSLAADAKVCAVPMSVFFLPSPSGDVPHHLVRFAVCKVSSTIIEACARIRAHARRVRGA
jgi:aspartate/methionine/tyrosine aminotransferase